MRTVSIILIVLLSIAFCVTFYYGEIKKAPVPERVERALSSLNDRPSPKDRISKEDILVYKSRVILNISDVVWAQISDTNSMDPLIDSGHHALEFEVNSTDQLQVGDVVSYQSKYMKGNIFHRIIKIGNDELGWYAILKGDNNPTQDPGRIRINQIERVLVAIIY